MNNYNPIDNSENTKEIQYMSLGDFILLFETEFSRSHFSLRALEDIYDYLNDVYREFIPDAVSIRCDFVEMSARDIADSYGIDVSDLDDEEREEEAKGYDTDLETLEVIATERLDRIRKALEDVTSVISVYNYENEEPRIVFLDF